MNMKKRLLAVMGMSLLLGSGSLAQAANGDSQATSIQPGVLWEDTEGEVIQAHGGSIQRMEEGTGEGQVAQDLDGDGEITEGKAVWLWYGEDKTHNTRPVDGVKCYSSTDLVSWKDHGTVLYLQNQVYPVKLGEEESKLVYSPENLEQIKDWGRQEGPPEGVSQEAFDEVKNFLRAYVTEFEKAPTSAEDTSWKARSYDETPMETTDLTEPNGALMKTTRLALAFQILYGRYSVAERPKMIYNSSTKKFVIAYHADGPLYDNSDLVAWYKAGNPEATNTGSRYSRALIGFAESETPFGPFKLVNATRMNWVEGLNDNRKGESRDMTVFVDKGEDRNGDGIEDAYAVYSSEMNAKLYVSLLNGDYTGPAKQGSEAVLGADFQIRVLSDDNREAPTVFKHGEYYYMLTSGTDGWNSTKVTYYRARDMFGPWEGLDNPCIGEDNAKGFDSQPTYVFEVDAEKGQYIYMGDRWNASNLTDSRYVWLPIQLYGDNTLALKDYEEWTPWDGGLYRGYKLLEEAPHTASYVGKLPVGLPDTVRVLTPEGKETETAVSWELDTKLFDTPYEKVTVTGNGAEEGLRVEASVEVVPKHLIYFVSAGTGTGYFNGNTQAAVSAPYEAVAKLVKDLYNKTSDALYSEESGWGHLADANTYKVSATVDNGDRPDAYISREKYLVGLRDKSNAAAPMAYRFTLEAGTYTLTAGYHEFYGSNRKRDMQPSVVWTDGEGKEQVVKGELIQLRSADQTGTISFTLEDRSVVEYRLSYVSGEKPMYSWLAVEQTGGYVLDKDSLESMVSQAEEKIAWEYTAESYGKLTEALEAAREALKDEAALQEEIDEAKKALEEALLGLKPIPPAPSIDKSALETVIAEAQGLDEGAYTAQSYAALAEALKRAREIAADGSSAQEAVDSAVSAVRSAIAGLKKAAPAPAETKVQLEAPAVKSLKSTAAKKGVQVKITISRVNGADTYTVYRKVGKKVTVVGTTRGTSVLDKSPVSGKKASYYAAASSVDIKYTDSGAGKAKTIKLPRNTANVRAKKAGNYVTVKFSGVKGAKGYLIYRSTKKNGTFTKLTKKPIKKLQYTDKKAKAGKNYYYKVVTYGKNRTYSTGKVSGKIKR